jgi:hypothetical protein
MLKHFKRLAWVGTIIGPALMIIATRSFPEDLKKADSYISINLKALGITNPPTALATSLADNLILTFGVILVAVCIALIGSTLIDRAFGLKDDNFDKVRSWSMSVDMGNFAIGSGKLLRIFDLDCTSFTNHSITCQRTLDITAYLPYNDKSKPPVVLNYTKLKPTSERIGPDTADRYSALLQLPLTIPPLTTVEGRLEFYIPEGIDGTELDPMRIYYEIRERTSGYKRVLRDHCVYDALRQKAYRGRLQEPYPWRRALVRRWVIRQIKSITDATTFIRPSHFY